MRIIVSKKDLGNVSSGLFAAWVAADYTEHHDEYSIQQLMIEELFKKGAYEVEFEFLEESEQPPPIFVMVEYANAVVFEKEYEKVKKDIDVFFAKTEDIP